MDICDFAYRVIRTGKIQSNFLTDMGSTRKLWLLGGKNLSDTRFGYSSSIIKIHTSRPALSSRTFYSDGNTSVLSNAAAASQRVAIEPLKCGWCD